MRRSNGVLALLMLMVACDNRGKPKLSDTALKPTPAPSIAGYPRIVPNACMGESCTTSFPAIACQAVQLRMTAADTASLGPHVPLHDTVQVTQTDLHLEAPGIVVFRGAYVLDDEEDDDGNKHPLADTLRFAAGDTLHLVQYIGLGRWEVKLRGESHVISDGFWHTPENMGDVLGGSSPDSSVAVARSYPRISTWWDVQLRDGRRGFWKFHHETWREGLKPEGKYWEQDCRSGSYPTP